MFFRFHDPVFVWLMLFLAIALLIRRKWARRATLRFPSNWAMEQIVRSRKSRIRTFLLCLRTGALVLMVLVLMRPQSGRNWTETESSGVDIMLILDLSGSMLAHDLDLQNEPASRLAVTKTVVSDFIDMRPDDRIGMIVFAEEPFLMSPLTTQHEWLKTNLTRLEIGTISPNSTAIGTALGMGINRLKHVESGSRILILLTDGDNNAGSIPPPAAAEAARSHGIRIYTIGVGKSGSVPVPRQRMGRIPTTPDGKPIMDSVQSDIDEQALREIAFVTGGSFFRAVDTDSLRSIYSEIDSMEKKEVKVTTFTDATEWMHLPLLIACIALMIEQTLRLTLLNRLP